jgi:hypothetical protein
MRAATFVVGKIALQSSAQGSPVPHDDVIQAFSPDGSHKPFHDMAVMGFMTGVPTKP